MTAPMDEFKYVGDELAIFEHAKNWKRYFADILRPFIGGDVAEVGAGVGGSTEALFNGAVTSWLCIEPDAGLVATIDEKIKAGRLPAVCRTRQGRLEDDPDALFDTIVYIDVIEHIEDDLGGSSQRVPPFAARGSSGGAGAGLSVSFQRV